MALFATQDRKFVEAAQNSVRRSAMIKSLSRGRTIAFVTSWITVAAVVASYLADQDTLLALTIGLLVVQMLALVELDARIRLLKLLNSIRKGRIR